MDNNEYVYLIFRHDEGYRTYLILRDTLRLNKYGTAKIMNLINNFFILLINQYQL